MGCIELFAFQFFILGLFDFSLITVVLFILGHNNIMMYVDHNILFFFDNCLSVCKITCTHCII